MRFVIPAALFLFGSLGAAGASSADYSKYYYFDYAFYPGVFNIFVDTMETPDGGTVTYYEMSDPLSVRSWPMFHFGFFLKSYDVEGIVGSPFTFSTSNGEVDTQRGMDGIYFYRPDNNDDHAEGSLSFDLALNIISWDVSAWSCFACNADQASSTPTPLSDLWESLLGGEYPPDFWRFPTGTDLPEGNYYSSNYWEPLELMYSTAIGRWEKKTSVVCYSYALYDVISCPADREQPAPIPLPASLPLLAGGLFLLSVARRFRRRKISPA